MALQTKDAEIQTGHCVMTVKVMVFSKMKQEANAFLYYLINVAAYFILDESGSIGGSKTIIKRKTLQKFAKYVGH